MNTKQIGIRFFDNDFYHTVRGFLRAMSNSENCVRPWDSITKEKVVWLFNETAPGLYWACQMREWDKSPDPKMIELYKNYLKITEDNVYLDDEVNDFLEENSWDNAEFHFITLDLNQIFTI